MNCLIIDDEPASREVLETFFKDTSTLVLIKSCKNALEANLELKQNKQIDLIFLDINMPKLNGMDFYHSHPKVEKMKCPQNPIFLFSPQKQIKHGTLQAKQKYQQTSNPANIRFSSAVDY